MNDGGVGIYQPSARCLSFMSNGGRWPDMPNGFLDTQIERQVKAGHQEAAVVKFCRAMAFGGLTEKEALAVLRDRDVAYQGSMIELYDVDDIPTDRWFRDAWARSHNGGPVGVDLKKAKVIQWQKLADAIALENKKRELDLFGPPPIEIPRLTYQSAIKHARDHEELRQIWVPGLSSPPS